MPIRSALLPAMVLPAAAVLLLAGCSAPAASSGGSDSSGGDAAASEPAGDSAVVPIPDNACDLLSADEATAAYGGPITTVTGEGGACSYSGDAGSFFVTVIGTGDDGWDLVLFDGDKPVSGIGDRAAGQNGTFHFQKGRVVVDITDPDTGAGAKVEAVAKVIAGNL